MVSFLPVFTDIIGETEDAALPIVGGVLGAEAYAYLIALEKEATQLKQGWLAGPEGALLVLAAVVGLIAIVELFTGSGSPDTGHEFRNSAPDLSNISGLLDNASPTTCWSGETAEEYQRRNEEHQAGLAEIAQADQQVAEALTTQSNQVEQTRAGLGAIKIAAIAAIAFATWLFGNYVFWRAMAWSGAFPGFSAAMAEYYRAALWNFVSTVANFVAIAVLLLIVMLKADGSENERALKKATHKYQDVVNDVAARIPADTAVTLANPAR